MSTIHEELKARGFVQQETAPVQVFHPTTHELLETLSLKNLLNNSRITYYVGFDPTADSLHIGHLLPIMAMTHLQRAGHTPIAIIGGGTTMIGDPSGKTETRQMLSKEVIASNGQRLLAQLKHYLDFGQGKGLFVNNAEWLLPLNYIEFLRDIGKHFRVNEMVRTTAYAERLAREEGLSFIEFNYQLLQAYDFLVLYEKYGCTVQMGGDDQWSNILAGIDLIRKVKQGNAHALTFPLLTTASGKKMGKTESGAVWLDSAKTSPYEYYQYWINTEDGDVEKFLKLFTFLPLEKITELCARGGQHLRTAKEALAFETTKITHGEVEAIKAQNVSRELFSGKGSEASHLPSTAISQTEVDKLRLVEVLVRVGLSSSKTEAGKLITSGGVYANGERVIDAKVMLSELLVDGTVLLRKGQKTFHKVVVG
ncbi:MAG: tyrosine--tRNA ligase [Candidatus Paceibacterota bacterium]|jgi:tyrosyl-tRNA synthetase